MPDALSQPLIISASRTKDMVHRSPDLLADLLLGQAPCRWGPHGPFGRVDPINLHSVVLWTKNPFNLLTHQKLRRSLYELREKHHVQISLHVTATGLGGTFVEPGIPHWREVERTLKQLLAEGWINPAAMIYRCDPFLAVRTPAGRVFSNALMPLFESVCTAFLNLGIQRVTTSRADAVRYPRIIERVRKLGLQWIFLDDSIAENLCLQMADFCRARGADFSICCDPTLPVLIANWGCIDARWLNHLKGMEAPPATEILHNRIGKQRPTCQCTYSRDIGYSTGSATCYSGSFGCLYCYAQGNASPPNVAIITREIQSFDRDPRAYLEEKHLPEIARSISG